ncbi:MAG: hypothetical protein ABIK30_13380 [bacterium]
MEINSTVLVDILNKNFGYPIVNTQIGYGVIVDCRTAFLYSIVTGAGYLDNPLYPFTAKGLMKVFYTAIDYKFVTGLFDNTTLKNTPYILSKAKPYLFSGDKIILPVEFKTEIELQDKLKQFSQKEAKPTDYLIQRIECSKQGNGMEPFMEYLACEIMKREGYIVENQIPLNHSTGSPDFGGYSLSKEIPPFFNSIHLVELSLIRLGFEIDKSTTGTKMWTVVGEAKTGTMEMKKQLDKYLATHLFDEGFEIHPSKKRPSSNYVGLITIDDQLKIKVVLRKEQKKLSDERQQDYFEWLRNYIKYYLIANLTNDEFGDFYRRKMDAPISSKESIVAFVNGLSFEEILAKISKVVEDGII